MKTKKYVVFLFLICISFQTCENATEVKKIDSLTQGLIAYYPFDGNADDASGNDNHGLVFGANLVSDRFDQPQSAYLFDGIDDYINLGNDISLKPEMPLSISAWIKRIGPGNHILRINYSELFRTGIWIGFDPVNEHLSLNYGSGGFLGSDDSWRSKYTEAPTAGYWFHLAVTLNDSADMEIYLNGLKFSGEYTGSADSLYYDDGPIYIGKNYIVLDQPPVYFNGLLDELRIYSRILSEQEIENLYLLN